MRAAFSPAPLCPRSLDGASCHTASCVHMGEWQAGGRKEDPGGVVSHSESGPCVGCGTWRAPPPQSRAVPSPEPGSSPPTMPTLGLRASPSQVLPMPRPCPLPLACSFMLLADGASGRVFAPVLPGVRHRGGAGRTPRGSPGSSGRAGAAPASRSWFLKPLTHFRGSLFW